MRALVLHPGDDGAVRPRSALAGVRALAAAGWTVGVGSPERDFVSASRSSRHWHRVPASWDSVEAFIEGARAAVLEGNYDLVFGAADADVLAVSLHRERLGVTIAHPPHERLLGAIDKVHLAAAARRAGLDTPVTFEGHVPDREVVVKPRISESVPHEPMLFSNPREAAYRVAELAALGFEPIVQERVRGPLMAYTVVADRDYRVVARVQQEARAIWPPGAGTSARAETVPIDESLAAKVSGLIEELGWIGLVELQFVVPQDRAPVLIDFNGRFYGSLALAFAAGVNLPAIWAAVAVRRPLPPSREASVGLRYQWEEGDLRRARAERKGGIARDLAGSFRYFAGSAHAVCSASDPKPALRMLRSVLAGSLSFRVQSARRRKLRPAR